MKSTINALVEENSAQLKNLLSGQVVSIPKGSCSCGKPIVFLNNKTKYRCTRCKEVYNLVVEIVKQKK